MRRRNRQSIAVGGGDGRGRRYFCDISFAVNANNEAAK
jgi:hypothetical protein